MASLMAISSLASLRLGGQEASWCLGSLAFSATMSLTRNDVQNCIVFARPDRRTWISYAQLYD